ncbi:effector binding domain-containing protein [Vibrio sp. 99-8-1]|uniref:GyrI-like domain-containing protein n=1 Tax=Vibrio sp. 99-8-1 TaxID=2607602 RepID=UPI0014936EE8|nr:effector binding domain-containing protein [Vibrio sp. 99-8-1]NOI68626.1 hypothetical protein [Vibrio sp. 99-8-1]
MNRLPISILVLTASLIIVVNMVFSTWSERHPFSLAKQNIERRFFPDQAETSKNNQQLSSETVPKTKDGAKDLTRDVRESSEIAKTSSSSAVPSKEELANEDQTDKREIQAKSTLAAQAEQTKKPAAQYVIKKAKRQLFVGHFATIAINSDSETQLSLAKAWKTFTANKHRFAINNKISDDIYLIYSDYSQHAKGTISLFIGHAVSEFNDLASDFKPLTVPSQSYASFQLNGDFSHIAHDAWQQLPSLNLNRSYNYDMEIYPSSSTIDRIGSAQLLISIQHKEL